MKDEKIYDVIIAGAGASGLMCAANIGRIMRPSEDRSFRGLILDGNDSPGRKLLLTGGGRCNITHSGSIKDFVAAYGASGRRLRTALYRHSNEDLIKWLGENGIDTAAEPDGRIFPASGRASDILGLLVREAERAGFEIRTGSKITALHDDGRGRIKVSCGDKEPVTGRRLVIATGGCSFAGTGSDGSMFRIAERDLGASVTSLRPALLPIQVKDYPYADISGVSFENASVGITEPGGRKIAETEGPLLLTHEAFSGPSALNASRYVQPGRMLVIDYISESFDGAFRRLMKRTSGSHADLANDIAAEFGVPRSFARIIESRSAVPGSGIPSPKKASRLLTHDVFETAEADQLGKLFDQAMITAGGFDLAGIDSRTFRMKDHDRIYVIGEALDVDGRTGGYNLQAAWSTAAAAADDITSSY
jgi:predicted Rossmann fold flavoprotein